MLLPARNRFARDATFANLPLPQDSAQHRLAASVFDNAPFLISPHDGDTRMSKKQPDAPSASHLQTIADKRAYLLGRIKSVLAGFERRKESPTTWQINQLNFALEFVGEDLFGLAACELDALAEGNAADRRPANRSSTKARESKDEKALIMLPQLLQRLQEVQSMGLQKPLPSLRSAQSA
jgi:hypothetical protein